VPQKVIFNSETLHRYWTLLPASILTPPLLQDH
jgi:hypothetical protein